ncbi:MAG: glutamine synthetase III [Synergistaceae bacterium]|nr:glutamine synthetase III [Synergistaceae bacterium]
MSENEGYVKLRDVFGTLMFDRRAMKERLNSEVYDQLMAAMEGRRKLDASLADTIAMAMRDWAISKGATHWSHWFHPLTELTAEKHLTFTLPSPDGSPIDIFRGKDLIQGEPDASSFPSGGRRSTFEARGYSAWDPSSPAFIVKSAKGGTLCIPSVFLSYDGTPLDQKTPLLRALSAIEERSLKLLKMFGQRGARAVRLTVGPEQEYFLLDRSRAQQRPDIRFCGRTLIGAQPAKDQELDHHYMGSISPRVLAYMDDVGRELALLGVPIMTRHNEVARCQFEFAPLFAEANVACDHNQIVMETMRKLARSHDLRLLFHEKPFADMNGSGKHINISLMDNEGRNLLKATGNHRRNVIFLTFLSAVVLGVAEYHSLLQASIATAGNMFRLGGHEAPPSIMSIYLGQTLTELLSQLDKVDLNLPDKEMLDTGLAKLPSLTPYDCDRNRTSPIAFTGDKFEFRAPGSSQSVALPVTLFASIWAWGLEQLTEMIEARMAQGAEAIDVALDAVKEAIKRGSSVLFEGDAYSAEWHKEARRRGLIEAETIPEKIDLFLRPKNKEMLERLGVFKANEIEMLHEIRMESFERALEIEASILYDMLWEGVLPAISKQLILEKKSLSALDGLDFPEDAAWKKYIRDLGGFKGRLIVEAQKLSAAKEKLGPLTARKRADLLVKEIVPLMDSIRGFCDAAELLIAADIWPYPIYRNLLSLSI